MGASGCHSFTANRSEQWRAAHKKEITNELIILCNVKHAL